jgi:alkane 1-monooxygenase
MHLLLPLVFTATPSIGLFLDWPWLSLSIGIVLIPLLELLIKGQLKPSSSFVWGSWFPRAVIVGVILQILTLACLTQELSWLSLILLAGSTGYVAGAVGIVLAHELAHRKTFFDKALARVLLLSVAYGHYALEHNRGHHRAAATYPDPATARREEGLWRFLPRYYSGVFTESLKLSQSLPTKLNETWALMSVTVFLFTFVTLIAGWKGLVFCLVQAAVAQLLVGAVDYAEHWGLVRQTENGKPERMGPQHIWDCNNTIADALLFNLPRHANHHLQPSLNCDQLTHTPASPQMPTGYAGMVLLTFIPPLYKKIMTPRLPAPLAENAIFMKDQHGS